MLIDRGSVLLVEDTQDAFQMIPCVLFQEGNLDDDTVMRQALDERIGNASLYLMIIIVEITAAYINDRLLEVSYLMSEYVDGYDG